ncbi:MarR family winged helix-turn-helix transcriptional regulator [Undibacterium sp. TJN19]|uniref:MarR family winged helix-turn-helix transcriptional regulator n=1 Tax=Undibacterium sp. TJN19 TaxID=3413055 RepID=UPI003BF441F9
MKKVKPSEPAIAHAGTVSELESHLGFWLRYVSNHVSGQFASMVEANGVSVSEWVALRALYPAGHTGSTRVFSAADLMDALGMTKGAVSKIVTRLEDKGLVRRVIVDTDKRAQQIMLTKAGMALVPTLAASADQNDQAFFGHLSATERKELMSSMKLIVSMCGLKQLPVD